MNVPLVPPPLLHPSLFGCLGRPGPSSTCAQGRSPLPSRRCLISRLTIEFPTFPCPREHLPKRFSFDFYRHDPNPSLATSSISIFWFESFRCMFTARPFAQLVKSLCFPTVQDTDIDYLFSLYHLEIPPYSVPNGA